LLKKEYTGEEFLIDADISNDGKKASSVAAITSKNKIASKIDFFEIKSIPKVNSVPVANAFKDDMVCSSIKSINNGSAVVFGDNKLLCMDGTSTKWEKGFRDEVVCRVDLSTDSIIVEMDKVQEKSLIKGKKHVIENIDLAGHMQGEDIELKGAADSIIPFDGYFVAISKTNAMSISKGKILWSVDINREAKYIKVFESKPQLLFVLRDKFEVVNIS
jgi:hypothetical protein